MALVMRASDLDRSTSAPSRLRRATAGSWHPDPVRPEREQEVGGYRRIVSFKFREMFLP
jgi:hypothetical protein